MIGLYGNPMGARRVPIVWDAGVQVGFGSLVATVSVDGHYEIEEKDYDTDGETLVETRIYTGTVSGTTTFTLPRVDLDPRYLMPNSASYVEADPDTVCFVRHPRWLFPGIASASRGSGESGVNPMALTTATMRWNNPTLAEVTEPSNMAINATRSTDPGRALPYDNDVSTDYTQALGGQMILTSDRGMLRWTWNPLVSGDVPTGPNDQLYRFDSGTPYPSPAQQTLITDIHRTQLGSPQTVIVNQPHAPNQEHDDFPFGTRIYNSWSSTWTFTLQAI